MSDQEKRAERESSDTLILGFQYLLESLLVLQDLGVELAAGGNRGRGLGVSEDHVRCVKVFRGALIFGREPISGILGGRVSAAHLKTEVVEGQFDAKLVRLRELLPKREAQLLEGSLGLGSEERRLIVDFDG